MTFLGTSQLIARITLMATGVAFPIGMELTIDGLSDLIFNIGEIFITRNFSWKLYTFFKVSSAVKAVGMFGISTITKIAKIAKPVAGSIIKEAIELSSAELLMKGEAFAVRTVAPKLSLKAFGRVGSIAWKNFPLFLSEYFRQTISNLLNKPDLKSLLYKMYALDSIAGFVQLQSKVEQFLSEILQNSELLKLLKSTGFSLLRMFTDKDYQTNSNRCVLLTKSVIEELFKRLENYNRSSLKNTDIFHNHLKVNRNNSKIIACRLKSFSIFNEDDNFPMDENVKDHLECCRKFMIEEWTGNNDLMKKDIEICIDFVKKFYEEFKKIELDSLRLLNITVLDYIMDNFTAIFNPSNQSNPQCKKLSFRYNSLLDTGITAEDIYYEEIHENTEIGKTMIEKIKKMASDTQTGSKTRMLDLIVAAEMYKISLKIIVLTDKSLPIDKPETGTNLIFVKHSPNNEIEQAFNVDNHGEIVKAMSNGSENDCAFDALSKILEKLGISKSTTDIRNDISEFILANSTTFSRFMEAEKWVRMYHPHSFKKILRNC